MLALKATPSHVHATTIAMLVNGIGFTTEGGRRLLKRVARRIPQQNSTARGCQRAIHLRCRAITVQSPSSWALWEDLCLIRPCS